MKYRNGSKRHKVLEWCSKTTVLESQIAGSGLYDAAQELRSAGLLERVDDPKVKDAFGYPADSYRTTEAGRAELTAGSTP